MSGAIEERVVAWRRDIHQHPELGNREFRTAKLVERHLLGLGLEVRSGVAHTGVVGLLRGSWPGPVIALRADMDALPVAEEVQLPFASRETAEYNGQTVGVMHACGHDAHVAVLMGVAELLAAKRDLIRGTLKFIFQPAEEGAPEGEEGGAELMIREGVLEDPRVDAIFGLHVTSRQPVGRIAYRPGSIMAAVDAVEIVVQGRQTHGAYPWLGIDPVVVASQIVMGLQTIASRQLDATIAPAIVTIGSIHGGVRNNIIPDEVRMLGTLRSLDESMRAQIHQRVRRTAESIAESAGASATVKITRGYPVTYNDPALTDRMLPALSRVAGAENVERVASVLGAEDFSFFQQKVPGLFYFVGTRPADVSVADAAPNHSPRFFLDESGLPLALHSLAAVALHALDALR
jgi:amidohydrolase